MTMARIRITGNSKSLPPSPFHSDYAGLRP
jgi:hypothetical protein